MNAIEYLLTEYEPFDHLEAYDLAELRKFTDKYFATIYDRVPNQPLVTASAIVVNPMFTKILTMRHRVHHNMMKQFGGHAEGVTDLAWVADDELFSESGARGKLLTPTPIDLIRWNVPEATKNNIHFPEHDGFDIAFLFMMSEREKLKPNKREVMSTEWVPLEKWRDHREPKNPVYVRNPQNPHYQQRIFKKIKLFEDGYGR